jgi:hypothetical protein
VESIGVVFRVESLHCAHVRSIVSKTLEALFETFGDNPVEK